MKVIILTILLTIFVFAGKADAPKYETYVATAYSLRGKMANGQRVHYGAIAADPRVLPIGSKVHIAGMGVFTVKDTGKAIKGRRIDIWMSSRQSAIKFGRRKIQLKVL